MTRRLASAVVVALALVAATASHASAQTLVIRGDVELGAFAVRADGSLAGAVAAFGEPTRLRRRSGGRACRASWLRHGLTIDFYNLGGQDACEPRYGRFSRAIARGPHWQTTKRLRLGDDVERLRSLYPHARFRRGEAGFWPAGWWLVRRSSVYGNGSSYPGLLAQVRAGKVVAFHIRFPAGGD